MILEGLFSVRKNTYKNCTNTCLYNFFIINIIQNLRRWAHNRLFISLQESQILDELSFLIYSLILSYITILASTRLSENLFTGPVKISLLQLHDVNFLINFRTNNIVSHFNNVYVISRLVSICRTSKVNNPTQRYCYRSRVILYNNSYFMSQETLPLYNLVVLLKFGYSSVRKLNSLIKILIIRLK